VLGISFVRGLLFNMAEGAWIAGKSGMILTLEGKLKWVEK